LAYPVIIFHATEGSDTAASGAGPAVAVTGTASAHTGGVASTTITFTNSPDLSGVATDGSAVLWMKTASGRQFFGGITAVDNTVKTVTTPDSVAIAAGSAVDWAIGGKRASMGHADNLTLPTANGVKPGWEIVTETDQTIGASWVVGISGAANNQIVLRGEGTQPTINSTVGSGVYPFNFLSIANWRIKNLKFTCSNAATNRAYIYMRGAMLAFEDCTFGDPVNRVYVALGNDGGGGYVSVNGCIFQDTIYDAIRAEAGQFMITGCLFRNTQSTFGPSPSVLMVNDCVFYGSTTAAAISGTGLINFKNCTIHGNSGNGLDFSGATPRLLNLLGNNITSNGLYGVKVTAGQSGIVADFNNFGTGATANTSGARLNIAPGPNDLAVDPQYADAANGDFRVGTNLKAQGYPQYIGAVRSYVDVGAYQREEQGGGTTITGVSKSRIIGGV
jgi:hypothetical protein